jgi:ion channel
VDALLVAAGAVIVAIVGWDIALTLLHPAARGPLSYRANRWAWRLVRGVSRSRRTLSYAGPLAIAANMLLWVVGLWCGFALVYASGVSFGDALYKSGEALTTVGFGDIEFDPEWLRYVAVVEAAGGLGVFTAAIAYVLSVYPLVTAIRASALFASLYADAGETSEAASLTQRLIECHEHVKRFPVLYYFESGDEAESMTTLFKAAVRMCALLREDGQESRAVPLERALNRLFDDLERDYIGGRGRRVEAVAERDSRARAERVIGAFAREHRQESGLGWAHER